MIFFAPVVLSAAAVGSVWQWIYAPYFGLVTNIAVTLGLAAVSSSLLASQATALWAIMGAFVWRWAGFNTVIYLAGLQAIPKETQEAAMIEGAGGLRRFRHITWPLLLPYTYTVVLLTTMGTLRIFDMMWIMTQGGPAHATETIATYISPPHSASYPSGAQLLRDRSSRALWPACHRHGSPLVMFAIPQRTFTEGLTVGASRS